MIELLLLPLSSFQFSTQIRQENITNPHWSSSVSRIIDSDYQDYKENYINNILQWDNIKSIIKEFSSPTPNTLFPFVAKIVSILRL